MTQIRSKESLRRFYTAAIAAGADTPEGLNTDISARCRTSIERSRHLGASHGLDLGYGTGHHTLAMLEAGLTVTAIDQIPTQHLAAAATQRGLGRLDIHQHRLEDFTPDRHFGLVIAKDVLHYLDRAHIERILAALVDHPGPAVHHLEVFCDIWRITGADTPVVIEGEAALGTDVFTTLVQRLYRGWELQVAEEAHVENDTATGRPYFAATRVVVTAERRRATRGSRA